MWHWLGQNWHDLSDTVNHVVSIFAIILAGIFGYLRFVRGRVLHSDLALTVTPELVKVGGSPAMTVGWSIADSGNFRQIFPLGSVARIDVLCMDDVLWQDAKTDGEIYWTMATTVSVDLLKVEGEHITGQTLEPGEVTGGSTLVPIPDGNWLAFRVQLTVESRSKYAFRTGEFLTWTAGRIVVNDG